MITHPPIEALKTDTIELPALINKPLQPADEQILPMTGYNMPCFNLS